MNGTPVRHHQGPRGTTALRARVRGELCAQAGAKKPSPGDTDVAVGSEGRMRGEETRLANDAPQELAAR